MAPKSRPEQLLLKRERERKRRKKIYDNPKSLMEENRKRRQRYARQKKDREKKKSKMTKREITLRRRKWRLAKRKAAKEKRQRLKKEDSESKVPSKSAQYISGQKRRNQTRAKHSYQVSKLQRENDKLRRTVSQYRTKLHRLTKAERLKSDSPRSRLSREMARGTVSPAVRKRLLFGEALKADLKSAWNSIASTKRKREFKSMITFRYVKKYKFMCSAKPFLPMKLSPSKKEVLGCKRKVFEHIKETVRKFYEQDDVSMQAPGKKECKTKNKVKKQKRYVTHSLKFLYRKFCNENEFTVSYSTFCKLRPFWIVDRKIDERDTCVCMACENISYLHQALRTEGMLLNTNAELDTVIEEEMCCAPATVNCFLRKCPNCVNKEILFSDYDGSGETSYEVWEKIEESGTDGKSYRRRVKNRIHCECHELISNFCDLLPEYMRHIGRVKNQYQETKKIKKNLGENDFVFHIDFSENYTTKYFREIQACHFGANKTQVTLHTGIKYHAEKRGKCFCTVTDDLRHDAIAVWSHLKPVLEKCEKVESLHFISDSPFSQYRNKILVHVIFSKIIPLFPDLKVLTWNYSESGHGKGPADGVGGTVKRTCDKIVANNVRDIANFNDFFAVVTEHVTEKIEILKANNRDSELETALATKPAIPIPGNFLLIFILN
jgi:hypothetical protein